MLGVLKMKLYLFAFLLCLLGIQKGFSKDAGIAYGSDDFWKEKDIAATSLPFVVVDAAENNDEKKFLKCITKKYLNENNGNQWRSDFGKIRDWVKKHKNYKEMRPDFMSSGG